MCVTVCACRRTRMATHLDGRHQRHEPRSRQRGPEHAVGVEADAHLARAARAPARSRGDRVPTDTGSGRAGTELHMQGEIGRNALVGWAGVNQQDQRLCAYLLAPAAALRPDYHCSPVPHHGGEGCRTNGSCGAGLAGH